MEPKEFLISRLNELFLKLENIEISYEYRDYSNTHLVEVKPASAYLNCEEYIEDELALEKAFNDTFPSQELLFITEGSLTQISLPEFILKSEMKPEVLNTI